MTKIPGSLLSIASFWWLSFMFARTWWFPTEYGDPGWVLHGTKVFLIEFLVVHSTGILPGVSTMTNNRFVRAAALTGVALLYVVLGLAFGGSGEVYVVYVVMLAARIFMLPTTLEGMDRAMIRWGFSAACYLACLFASVLIDVPEGGVSPELIEEIDPDHGEGEWEKAPYRALAAGTVYFFLVGLGEVAALLWRAVFGSRAKGGSAGPAA